MNFISWFNYNSLFILATLADPQLYVEAISQNAFDTAAGMGLFTAYAAYFSRKTGAVRYGVLLPLFNNLVRFEFIVNSV